MRCASTAPRSSRTGMLVCSYLLVYSLSNYFTHRLLLANSVRLYRADARTGVIKPSVRESHYHGPRRPCRSGGRGGGQNRRRQAPSARQGRGGASGAPAARAWCGLSGRHAAARTVRQGGRPGSGRCRRAPHAVAHCAARTVSPAEAPARRRCAVGTRGRDSGTVGRVGEWSRADHRQAHRRRGVHSASGRTASAGGTRGSGRSPRSTRHRGRVHRRTGQHATCASLPDGGARSSNASQPPLPPLRW